MEHGIRNTKDSKNSFAHFLSVYVGCFEYPIATICMVCQKNGPHTVGGRCILISSLQYKEYV
jgi:hypothetical protein